MAKRRTKKDKKTAKHPFLRKKETSSTKPKKHAKKPQKVNTVKDQSKKLASKKKSSGTKAKKPMNKAEYENLRLIKKHLVKSLSLAALILSLEVVIYLVSQG